MGMEALGFDKSMAQESKSAFAVVLSRLLEHALLRASGSWEDEEFAIGEDAVNVEQE
jgi:hypothetical protein